MACSQCGKSNTVTINNRRYCANCGHPLKTATAKKHPSKKSPSAVLDLTRHSGKVTKPSSSSVSVSYRRPATAHTVHGAHRENSSKHTVKQRAPNRVNAATTINKSALISKFHRSTQTGGHEARDMSPHHSYAVAAVPKQKQLADHITGQRKPLAQQAASVRKSNTSQRKRKGPLKKLRSSIRRKPRLATAASLAMAAVVLGAYITYLNFPNIKLRVAAGRAGLDAQIPRYTPTGYDLEGPITYGPGQLTIRFNSNADDNYINLSQRKTDWDSQTLLENYVKPKSDTYQTNIENGLTIYLFAGSNAAWVNSGVLYTIEGQNKLNAEQILKIASSL